MKELLARIVALPERDVASLRAVRREFSKRLANAEASEILDIARQLLRCRDFDLRFIAYELVQHHPAAFAALDTDQLEALGLGLDSWGAVDCFACYLAGPAWQAR